MINKFRENKLPPTKIPQKFTPSIFTLLNFNEIGCKQCNENDQVASVFCYFQILSHEIREKLFPRVKSEIEICENFSLVDKYALWLLRVFSRLFMLSVLFVKSARVPEKYGFQPFPFCLIINK